MSSIFIYIKISSLCKFVFCICYSSPVILTWTYIIKLTFTNASQEPQFFRRKKSVVNPNILYSLIKLLSDYISKYIPINDLEHIRLLSVFFSLLFCCRSFVWNNSIFLKSMIFASWILRRRRVLKIVNLKFWIDGFKKEKKKRADR